MTTKTPRDRRSLDRALREGIPAVLDVMRLRGVPENDREDAAQKALTRAFEHIDAYDPMRPFLPWLKTIAHRAATDHLRALRSRRKREDVTADGVPESIDQRAPNEEQMIRRHDAPKLLEEVLAALSDDRRDVFVMAEVDELSPEQIAAILQTNANTVRSRLSRAREDFEAALKRRWIAEESRSGATVPLPAFLFSASALIDAGRSSSSAPDVLARVWSEVARAIGSSLPAPARPDPGGQTGGASPSAPQAPASPLSTLRDASPSGVPAWLGGGASVKATLIASAAVFGTVVGGGLLWVRATTPAASSPPIHRDVTPASATPAATATDTATSTITTIPTATNSISATTTASAEPHRVDPAVLERQESAQLDKAQGLFAAGKIKEGCDVLRSLAIRFPRGVYQEQRKVLWSAAKCGEVKP